MSHPTWSDAPMDRDELEQALEFDHIHAGCDKEADVLRAKVAALEAEVARLSDLEQFRKRHCDRLRTDLASAQVADDSRLRYYQSRHAEEKTRLEADLAFVRECFETCLEEWREDRQAAYPLSGSGSLQALRDRIEDQARARQPQPEVPR